MDSEIPPLRDLPRLRARVTVEGHEGIFIVIAFNSDRREADLAGATHAGYLFSVPISRLRPVSNHPHGPAGSRPGPDPQLLRLGRQI